MAVSARDSYREGLDELRSGFLYEAVGISVIVLELVFLLFPFLGAQEPPTGLMVMGPLISLLLAIPPLIAMGFSLYKLYGATSHFGSEAGLKWGRWGVLLMSAALVLAVGISTVGVSSESLTVFLVPLVIGSAGRVLLGMACSSMGELYSSRSLEMGGKLYAFGAVLAVPVIVVGVPLILIADMLLYQGSGGTVR